MSGEIITKYIKKNTLSLFIKPNAPKTEVLGYDKEKDAVRIAVHALPENNKANEELLKFLKKQLKKDVKLIKGKTSKQKVVRVLE